MEDLSKTKNLKYIAFIFLTILLIVISKSGITIRFNRSSNSNGTITAEPIINKNPIANYTNNGNNETTDNSNDTAVENFSIGFITGDKVNFRRTPLISNNVIFQLLKGTECKVYGFEGEKQWNPLTQHYNY